MSTALALTMTAVETNPAHLYMLSLTSVKGRRAQVSGLRDFLKWASPGATIESFPWAELRAPHLYGYRDALTGRLMPRTANRYLGVVRSVVRFAWRLGQVDGETLARVEDVPAVPGETVPRGRALEDDELAELLAATNHNPSRWFRARDRAVLVLLYASGIRRDELVRLHLGDLAWTGAHLTIKVRGKGGKERLVPIAGTHLEGLQSWLVERGRRPGPLFTTARGSAAPMCADTVSRRVLDLSRRAKIVPCSPHDWRRTYATRLLDAGVDLVAVRDLLGHKSVATTAIYDRRGHRAKLAAADKLPPLPVGR